MNAERAGLRLGVLVLCLALASCAIVRPHLTTRQETPIDWGLECSQTSAITILPFVTEYPAWGVYAAQRLQEYMLAEKAFQRVILAEKEPVLTPYVLKGEIDSLYYGGTFTPSKVYVTIRVINRQDGHTRFLRKGFAEGEKRGLDLELMTRLYVSSPYPEELLAGLLKTAARDIAQRTAPTAHCPSGED